MSNSSAALDPSPSRLGDLADRLQLMIAAGSDADMRVTNFGVMEDGHAGLTFGFDVVSAPDDARKSYVLKIAPPGVTRRGNTDVYKQAPLLRSLKRAGLPVPGIPWASGDDDDLGTPYIVMEKMPGRVFVVWEPHDSFAREPVGLRELWLQAAQLLARVHLVDWKRELPDWEEPRSLALEIDRWTGLLRHAEGTEWHAPGKLLGELLAASTPEEQPVGLIHGDFQPGNILYDNGKAGGLIDWELASIGAQGLDVGWLLMMSDAQAWHPGWRPVAPISADDLLAAYRATGGPADKNLAWYQALSHYRLGSIACLNVKLHRSGKRHDPLWDRFAPSISFLFARGIELARQASNNNKV